MMGPTHAMAGLALASPLTVLAPELAPVGALAGVAGGFFPDLDLLVGQHRRTLHFPDYYWLVALPATGVALLRPGPATVAVALFALSAAVHSVADLVGAGLDMRPWERQDRRGVYLHSRGRWLEPRYWIRYDGAPEDLVLAGVLSAPGLVLFGETVRRVTIGLVAVAVAYVLVRRRLPDWGERLGL